MPSHWCKIPRCHLQIFKPIGSTRGFATDGVLAVTSVAVTKAATCHRRDSVVWRHKTRFQPGTSSGAVPRGRPGALGGGACSGCRQRRRCRRRNGAAAPLCSIVPALACLLRAHRAEMTGRGCGSLLLVSSDLANSCLVVPSNQPFPLPHQRVINLSRHCKTGFAKYVTSV